MALRLSKAQQDVLWTVISRELAKGSESDLNLRQRRSLMIVYDQLQNIRSTTARAPRPGSPLSTKEARDMLAEAALRQADEWQRAHP